MNPTYKRGAVKTSGFDVVFTRDGADVVPHFCREIKADGTGCYGTNPEHGMAWATACREVAEWHRVQAAKWEMLAKNGEPSR